MLLCVWGTAGPQDGPPAGPRDGPPAGPRDDPRRGPGTDLVRAQQSPAEGPGLWGGLGPRQPALGGVLLLHVGVVVQLLEGLEEIHTSVLQPLWTHMNVHYYLQILVK